MNHDKQKPRFNFIDVLIILIILAVVGAAVYLIASENAAQRRAENANIEFTVRISSVDAEYLSSITEGQTVKDSETGAVLGTIRSVRTENAKYYGNTAVPSESGYTISTSEYEDKYDVYVTISAYAKEDERGIYSVGSTRVLVGSAVYFKVPSFASVSYIVEFSAASQ
jgi:hypothetical protein